MSKYFVTGAGGFLGRALVNLLSEQGHVVIAGDNNFRGNLNTLESSARIIPVFCDVLDSQSVLEHSRGVDAIFHLAAINGTENFYNIPDKVLEVGIIGTHNVAKAALAHKTKRLVFASSSEMYNNPSIIPTPEEVEGRVPDVLNARFSYGGGKLAGELIVVNYLRSSSTKFTIFRPHNVYGPQMGFEHVIPQFVRKIHDQYRKNPGSKELIIEIQGDGQETRSFIYADDAARGIALSSAETLPSGVVHIGTQEEYSILEVLKLVGNTLGFTLSIRTSPRLPGSPTRRCPNTDKLKSLGFVHQTKFAQGLERTVRWYWDYFQGTAS